MELMEAITGAGACRYFTPDPVPDEVLARLFDAARFGPQGGKRQPLRYVVVRDAALKRQLRDWYLQVWESIAGGHRGADRVVTSAADFAATMHGHRC